MNYSQSTYFSPMYVSLLFAYVRFTKNSYFSETQKQCHIINSYTQISTASIVKIFSSESFRRGQEVMQDSSFKFLCTDLQKFSQDNFQEKSFSRIQIKHALPPRLLFVLGFSENQKDPTSYNNSLSVSGISDQFLGLIFGSSS